MKSYMEQLQNISQELGIELLDGFRCAGIPTSTYYRSVNGTTDLRYDTAFKISEALDEEYKKKLKNLAAKELRANDFHANRSKTREKIKPTKTS